MFVEESSCIILSSEMNEWINICVVVPFGIDFLTVEEVASEAFEDWFDAETDEPIGDYIDRILKENDLECVLYYKPDIR